MKLLSSIVLRLVEMMPIFSMSFFFHISISKLINLIFFFVFLNRNNPCCSCCPFFKLRLLGLYLDPQNGKEPMFTAAVRLLHNHGESLDPIQVLEVLLHCCFNIADSFENLVACMLVCKMLVFWPSVF